VSEAIPRGPFGGIADSISDALAALRGTLPQQTAITVGRSERRRAIFGRKPHDSRGRHGAHAKPHGSPLFIAISRTPSGRRYHQCATRDQALNHKPYVIEHVNGWGQVTRRERFPAGASA